MMHPQTKGALEALALALAEAEKDFTNHAAAEKLAGNVVKEAACTGMASGVRLTILAIYEAMMNLEAQLKEAASNPMNKDFLRSAAEAVNAKLPDNFGFILMAAPYGDDKRLVYVSTLERSNALNVLKEFLLRNDAAEDWMKHIK